MIDHQPSKRYERRSGLDPIQRASLTKIKEAYSFIQQREYEMALSILWDLERSSLSNPHEHALVLQTLGHLYARREDYVKALDFFELCFQMKSLPESAALSTLYAMAQLNHSLKFYQKTIDILIQWMSMSSSVPAEAFVLMASSYSELGQHELALFYIEKAIATDSKPKESWLQFLLALQYELKKFDEAVKTLNSLVEHYPKDLGYWRELANLYMQKLQMDRALLTFKLLQQNQGADAELEILNLVGIYLDENRPHLAAKLLERAIHTQHVAADKSAFDILAKAWQAADQENLSKWAQEKAFALSGKESIES